MRLSFIFCSWIYRIVLALIIPAEIIGNFLSAAAGHSRSFTMNDYLFFGYLIATVGSLTLYQKLGIEEPIAVQRTLLFVTTGLVLTSVGFEIYSLYDTLVICKCFTGGDKILLVLTSLFLFVTLVILWHLSRNIFKSITRPPTIE
jgi:hypothetical protein